MSHKITDKELLDELIKINNILGKTPKQKDLKYGKYSINAYKRAFCTFNNALIICGLKPNQLHNNNKQDVINSIIRIHKDLKKIPTAEEFSKHAQMTFQTLKKVCNGQSWHSLLMEAGIADSEIAKLKKHNVTNEELYNEIIRLQAIFGGRYPTYYDMRREGKFSCNTYEKRFGSWIKAMHSLGFVDYVTQSIYKNQKHSMAKDNCKYKSSFEARIADALFDMKNAGIIIDYEYEKRVCKNKSWTCDFVITKNNGYLLWIEADGMMNNRKNPYDKKNEKICFYKSKNFDYVILKYRTDNFHEELLKLI